ncbi:hypothetical protein Taro_023112 [Colocasia esculenta]|uniref:Histone H2A n=1 Tax=Colocasia esculenta TaxID=4460 RepID=A0A843V3C2_COLES|nr:hypothetical protein [Colocasia esculenta]
MSTNRTLGVPEEPISCKKIPGVSPSHVRPPITGEDAVPPSTALSLALASSSPITGEDGARILTVAAPNRVPIPFFALPSHRPPHTLALAYSPSRRTHPHRRARSFAVGRVARFLKTGHYAQRVSFDAPVYLFAVLEYLAAEVLELARHIQLAVRNDQELSRLLGEVRSLLGAVRT